MICHVKSGAYHVNITGIGPPVVLLHGFTGSAESWSRFAQTFNHDYQTISIDLPGHGQTIVRDGQSFSMEHVCESIKEILDQLEIEQAAFIGYSMGGRTALAFANMYPERVSSLILESASPGLKTSEERDHRKISDEELALFIEKEGVERFTDRWEQVPLFASQKQLSREKRQEIRSGRLKNSEEGLAASLRHMGTGSQHSYWESLHTLHMPVLLLTGEWDQKFINIATEMEKSLPNAIHQNILQSGHAIQVEQPGKFDTMVREFLLKTQLHIKEVSFMTREWVQERNYEDILYETYNGIAKISINRPEVRNAFRPKTVMELIDAFAYARDDSSVGVIVLAGVGDKAFCSGGDQSVRGHGGYVGEDEIPRLNVLDLQRLIRVIPKPVIAMVSGYAIGGGHVLHVVCDLTIAADNAIFGQTGPKVGSFDAGYGSGYLARIIGHKKAREIWFLCRQYDAKEALDMGLVNTVVPLDQLEDETVKWCEEMLEKSPTALRFVKAAMNADTDGLAGLQQFAGDATLLYYTTDEAKEGRDAFKEKRKPDFGQFPRFP